MSFPRAKIIRFNDNNPCTPSPADYDVKTNLNAKSAVISKSARHPDEKSPTWSDKCSIKSTPCFKTPTSVRKFNKKAATPLSTTKTNPKELSVLYHDLEALNDKIVECKNKDLFIKDLSEQIEELKSLVCALEQNLKDAQLEKIKALEQTNILKEQHEETVRLLEQNHADELAVIEEEKSKISKELANIHDSFLDLDIINEAKKKEVEIKEAEIKTLENNYEKLQKKHVVAVQDLKEHHMQEMQDIEFELLKTMTELGKEKDTAAIKFRELETAMKQEIAKLNCKFQEEKALMVHEHEAKLKLAEENFVESSKLADVQFKEKMRSTEESWKTKLQEQANQYEAILKECQTISEYTIINSELEKNALKIDLDNKITDYNNLLKKLSTEPGIDAEALHRDVENKNQQIKHLLSEKRTYQITINNFQQTVEVLKRRLINSDRDVEQLKKELTNNDEKLIDYETKCIQLTEDLKQAQQTCEELEKQYEAQIKINDQEIQEIKEDLTKKVNEYKSKVENYSKKLHDEKELYNQLLEQLQEQRQVNENAFELICTATNELDLQDVEIKQHEDKEKSWLKKQEQLMITQEELQENLRVKTEELFDVSKQMLQLQEKCDSYHRHFEYYKSKVAEYEEEIQDAGDIHKKYIEQSGRYDQLLHKYELLVSENEKHKRKLDESHQDDKYKSWLEMYEALEKENNDNKQIILNQRYLLEPFMEELETCETEHERSLPEKPKTDFVESRANYLRDIRKINEDLSQSKADLEAKVRQQAKTLEKLKKENAELKKCSKKFIAPLEDKENISSPNRSLNNSSIRIESPGPLRDRN